MKRKVLCVTLVLIICLLAAMPTFAVTKPNDEVKNASGFCSLNHSGRSVTIYGSAISLNEEETIRVTLYLSELQDDGNWHPVRMVSRTAHNATEVELSSTFFVSGGHYYKLKGIYYTNTNGIAHTYSSDTSNVWIG